MCECPSQLPRTQPVHIRAKRHKLGSQGMREVQVALRLAFPMQHPAGDSLAQELLPGLSISKSFLSSWLCAAATTSTFI